MCMYISEREKEIARTHAHTHTHTNTGLYLSPWLNFLPLLSLILFVDTSRFFLYIWVWNVCKICVCKRLSSSPFLLYPQQQIAKADRWWLANTMLYLTLRHCNTQSGSQHILRNIALQNKLGNVCRTWHFWRVRPVIVLKITTNWLASRIRVVEKLNVSQLVKKFHALCGSGRFITVCTRARIPRW